MTDLFIAAGGGGDPIGAALTAIAMGDGADGGPPVIATYAWERPEVDPTPGPLGVRDFTGLVPRPEGPVLTPAARAVAPAGSTLPRLAADLPVRLVLLDPHQGLAGLAEQIRRLAGALAPGPVRIVDVGGDILTHGDEDTLCSPLPDALVLAACTLAGIHATVHVAGAGTDGEIPQEVLLDRFGADSGARGRLTPAAGHTAAVARALSWHPSEASALFAAAVRGVRGTVATVGRTIPLTDASADVLGIRLAAAVEQNPVARGLLELRPTSVDEAADLSARLTGIHEIARERGPAVPSDPATEPFPADAHRAWERIRAMAGPASHVTSRFAVRALGLSWRHVPDVRALLGDEGPVHALRS
ncbi:DUF1152 domain-containing protein [Streptomyces sp. NPDC057257]|uniref:DUF1152 domain-containing protein n=1 Tax=Streptomyces sp. NPDC057257 TaxID=3346071 RepID=UPI003641D9FA